VHHLHATQFGVSAPSRRRALPHLHPLIPKLLYNNAFDDHATVQTIDTGLGPMIHLMKMEELVMDNDCYPRMEIVLRQARLYASGWRRLRSSEPKHMLEDPASTLAMIEMN